MKKIFFCLFFMGVLLISLISPSTISYAQADDPVGELTVDNPPPDGPFHPLVEQTVINPAFKSEDSTRSTCGILYWAAKTEMVSGLFTTRSKSTSISRDNSNHNIACNISSIGARGRLWISGTIYSDTGMLRAYNSADIIATTRGSDLTCGSGVFQAQGDHEFILTGVQSWFPISTHGC